jgi:putative FmdB family regulatory protein
MPLYEYQCENCGERVEIIQKMTDPPYSHCPKCSGNMRKLFSSPAIQFKGSGFYKTDYPSGTSKASSSKSDSSKSDSSASGSSADSKAETKSDKKSDSKPGE